MLCAQAPPTPESFLAQHGVAFTNVAIRGALKSPDPDLRGVAAGVLAERGDLGAVPLLKTALDQENIPRVKISFAAALEKLRDKRGERSLLLLCKENEIEPTARLMAANKLLDVGSELCLPQVLSILENKADQPTRDLGLLYLRRITDSPAALKVRIETFLINELQDTSPINRQYASEGLSVLGGDRSVVALDRALSQEKSDATRLRLRENLSRLQLRLKLNKT